MCFLKDFKISNNRFYRTLVSLNLGAICMGLTIGWPNPSIDTDIFEKNKNYGFITSGNLQTIINGGASIGAFLPILIADNYGRRLSFFCSAFACSIFWISLALAVNKMFLFFAATFAGFGTGIYVTTSVLYVGEISSRENRGIVGAFNSFFVHFGILIVGLLALYIKLTTLALVIVIIPLTFMFSIFFLMEESPYFLFKIGKVLDAKITLKNLRGRRTVLEIENDYKSMECFFNSEYVKEKKTTSLFKNIFFPKNAKKSLIIILPLMCLSQMMGSYAMNEYLEKILKHYVVHYEYAILSLINVLSDCFCLLAIEKIGRKILLIISIVGSAICCFLLALNKLIQKQDCQSLMKAGEIFPNRVKTMACGICISFIYITALSVQNIFELLKYKTNSCLAFSIFAILGSLGLPLIVSFLPETKGKSLYEIQSELDTINISFA
ncbi:uncharacterized protein LOC127280713 isoform X2 [Leptopilina boulardi]|uniref:uncharacterized protein LOC127280713 isoform X2 n=1 Tax=Leptopilina boulardi TaxID=63433 RepID=UPI0021F525AB|nr:uncharacterized protein LOC127280713 isoform X2 [Leptopilina boulardi]